MIAWTWALTAWAQTAQTTPNAPGDALRPSIDARATVGVDDSAPSGATGRLTLAWGHHRATDRDAGTAWLADGVAVFASGGATVGPVRIGVSVPAWVATGPGWEGARLRAGDGVLDVRAVPLAARPGRPGVGVVGRLTVPMGGWATGLGHRTVTGELGVLVDGRVGPVWMGVNAGWRVLPRVEHAGARLDDVAWGRAGVGVGGARGGVGVEAWGQVVPAAPSWTTSPIDVLGSAWAELPTARRADAGEAPRAHARLAVGGSAVPAMGAPGFRALLELGVTLPGRPPRAADPPPLGACCDAPPVSR